MRRPAGRNSLTEPAFSSQTNCEYGLDVPPSIDSLDLPPFKPRFPWWGADLQTIAVLLGTYQADLVPHRSERVCFCMPDGGGTLLWAILARPPKPQANRPLVILVHGVTGCENSSHVLNGAR